MHVSIIIPAFNSQAFIADCLDSIIAQTERDFECIVVDDGSTDGTLDICQQYSRQDKRFKIVVQNHYGPGVARNYGLNLAKGDYVQFVDSDDLLKPSALEETLSFIEANRLDFAMFEGEGLPVTIDSFKQLHVDKQLHMKANYGISAGKDFFCRLVEQENFNSYIFLQMQSMESINGRFSKTLMDEELLYSIRSLTEARKAGHFQKKLYVKRGYSGTILTSSLTVEKGILSLAEAMVEIKKWMNANASELGQRAVNAVLKILHARQNELKMRIDTLSSVQQNRIKHLGMKERSLLDAAAAI